MTSSARWLLVSVLTGACVFSGCGEKAPPTLHLPESTYDFGRFLERDSIQHAFVVENTGGDTLIIDRVIPGAGGGFAGFDGFDGRIAPGGSGRIVVGYEGGAITGKFARSWSIRSNDPAAGDVRLTITGEMVPYITVEPNRIYMSGTADEELDAVCLIATHDFDPNFAVESVDCDIDDVVSIQFVPGSRDGVWRARVVKRSDYRTVGSITGTLTFNTNHPVTPERSIPVLLAVEPAVRVEPPVVSFGTIVLTEGTSRETSIDVSSKGGGLELTGWKSSSDDLTAEIEEVDSGTRFKVHLTFTPTSSARPWVTRTLHLSTNHPDQPEITVKVTAALRRPGDEG